MPLFQCNIREMPSLHVCFSLTGFRQKSSLMFHRMRSYLSSHLIAHFFARFTAYAYLSLHSIVSISLTFTHHHVFSLVTAIIYMDIIVLIHLVMFIYLGMSSSMNLSFSLLLRMICLCNLQQQQKTLTPLRPSIFLLTLVYAHQWMLCLLLLHISHLLLQFPHLPLLPFLCVVLDPHHSYPTLISQIIIFL